MQEEILETILTEFSQHDDKKKAIDRLFQYIYFHLREFGVFYATEDHRSDFLLWLYPRLHTIITGYKPELSIFSTYLRMSLSYNWKLFKRRYREQAIYTSLAQDEQRQKAKDILISQDRPCGYEVYAASPLPKYSVSAEKERALQDSIKWTLKRKKIYSRYMLELLCKACFCIDEALLNTVAAHLEVPTGEIRQLIEEVKVQNKPRNDRFNEWLEKRDFYYIRYQSATLQLRMVDPLYTSVIERLKVQQTYSYNLWQRYLHRLKTYTRGPSNRELAKRLGISHATVDNDLAQLKKAWYGEP